MEIWCAWVYLSVLALMLSLFRTAVQFGISRERCNDKTSITTDCVGTWAYMAPEQFSNRVSEKVDVYALVRRWLCHAPLPPCPFCPVLAFPAFLFPPCPSTLPLPCIPPCFTSPFLLLLNPCSTRAGPL